MSPMMNRGNTITAPRNFDFVDFPKQVNTHYIKELKQRLGEFSGIIRLQIKTVDLLYLGNGFVEYEDKKGISSRSMTENKKAVIPGSAVKGAIRHVARAISDGCIPNEKDLNLPRELKLKCKPTASKEEPLHICIICDMFGAMGLGSKISISDFTSECCETKQCNVPAQFSPNINSDFYKENGCHIGYKFYYTNCESRSMLRQSTTIYAIPKGTVFTGDIHFHGLDKTELQLLMHSLGIGGEYFSHKLGGYRADGFGTVNFTCIGFILNGKECTPAEAVDLACQYVDSCSDDCYDRISLLRQLMTFRKE